MKDERFTCETGTRGRFTCFTCERRDPGKAREGGRKGESVRNTVTSQWHHVALPKVPLLLLDFPEHQKQSYAQWEGRSPRPCWAPGLQDTSLCPASQQLS